MYNSKAQISFLKQLVLVLVALAVLVAVFLHFSGIGFTNIGKCIDNYDQDSLPDCEDSCPCVSGVHENHGCPPNYKITGINQGAEDQSCLKKKK